MRRIIFAVTCVCILFVSGCKTHKEVATPEVVEEKIINKPEVFPQYPGGNEALANFIFENIKYPTDAARQKIEGRVIVCFVVNEDGTISNPEILRSVSTLFNAEVLRLVSIIPNFIPAMNEGKPVKSYCTLPINFKLPPEKLSK
ncbi:protein TonB [Dysgonomonadaceae bacterium PH5-43]|nr:protein TonB [Dysgonomonadaceae bacterium PH5-43]